MYIQYMTYSWKIFFIRCVNKSSKCKITTTTKSGCRSCRYNKCLAIGMLPELVKAKVKKIKSDEDITIVTDEAEYPLEYDPGQEIYISTF